MTNIIAQNFVRDHLNTNDQRQTDCSQTTGEDSLSLRRSLASKERVLCVPKLTSKP